MLMMKLLRLELVCNVVVLMLNANGVDVCGGNDGVTINVTSDDDDNKVTINVTSDSGRATMKMDDSV